MSCTVVGWTREPLVPVTVRLYVPVRAFLLAFTVIVEFPLPVTEEGLKLTETPLFVPDADKLTEPLNPLRAAIVTVSPVELFRFTEMGEPAEIEKSPVVADVTVSVKLVVSLVPSVVAPVTVTV